MASVSETQKYVYKFDFGNVSKGPFGRCYLVHEGTAVDSKEICFVKSWGIEPTPNASRRLD